MVLNLIPADVSPQVVLAKVREMKAQEEQEKTLSNVTGQPSTKK